MAIDTSVESRRALAQKGNHATSVWVGPMRNGDLMHIQDGDVLDMPVSAADCANKIIKHDTLNGAQSIMVSAQDAAGKDKVVEFWPGSICRVGFEFEEPEAAGMPPKPTGVRYPNAGDVVQAVRTEATLAEAMEKLYGKKIRYNINVEFKTRRYGTNELRPTNSWTISFVE